jgi:aminocarboxymuconate-semialdehyde decarboxylase
MYYDTLVFHHTTIGFLIDLLGVERLTIGTDYPFLQREDPVGKTLQSMNLTKPILDKINYQNALEWII